MLYTRNLKQIIEAYKQTLTDQDFQSLNNHIHKLTSNLIAELSSLAPGVARGRRIHELIENEIKKSEHIAVTCRKGCSACCHLEVEITEDDAAVLSEAIRNGITIDRQRVAMLAKRERNDKAWSQKMKVENRCVFLSSGGVCGVYESRPSACRKLSVTSNPDDCASIDGQPTPRLIPQAEIILSAAISLENNKTSHLAKMLNQRLELEESEVTLLTSDPSFKELF